MLISLKNDHKEHLSLLINQPTEVLVDFCKLAIDFVHNGPNLKLYGIAAQKLEVKQEAVQNCVYGLVNLLIIACKHKLTEADFRDSVLTIGFTQEQHIIFSKFYESKKNEILGILKSLTLNEPRYKDLDWRFEVIVSSRSLKQQVTPLITMDLQLKTSSDGVKQNVEHVLLQTDPTNLVHITKELEKALNESRSRHCRRIQKALHN